MLAGTRCRHADKSVHLPLHLGDPVERCLSLGQEDPGEGDAGVSDRHDEVQRERRAGGKPRPRQVGIVFSVHPESVQLWGFGVAVKPAK